MDNVRTTYEAAFSGTTRPIAIQNTRGIDFHYPILPNCWKGETNCIVGPFSGQQVAEYFASHVVDFGQYESFTYRVFPKRSEWYVEIGTLDVAPPREVLA